MSDMDPVEVEDSGGSDVDAFRVMRAGAEDQAGILHPWGQRGKKKKGMDRSLCRSEQETTRQPPSRGQGRLIRHNIRPSRWTAWSFDLDEDVLMLVANALMLCGKGVNARSLRALAMVNRACAKGVRAALNLARKKLGGYRLRYLAAQEKADLENNNRSRGPPEYEERLETSIEFKEARESFTIAMYSVGIPRERLDKILFNASRTFFQDNLSLLGHLGDGCELCGAAQSGRPWRGTYIGIHACRACQADHRVRFQVSWPPDEKGKVRLAILKAATVGNTYASAMLSRRAAHKRRMTSSRSLANRPIRLSKRVHYVECTDPLLCLVMGWLKHTQHYHGANYDGTALANIELWHALPKDFERHTFSSVLELCEHGEDRERAAHHERKCKERRHKLVQRSRDFDKLLKENAVLVNTVNGVLDDPDLTDWGSWHLAMDLCCAARAFDLRWVFAPRVRFSPGRDWLGNRFNVLKVHPDQRRRMFTRIDVLISALKRGQRAYARERDDAKCQHGPLLRLEHRSEGMQRARKCYLEIAKRIPEKWLEQALEADAVFSALRDLRRAHMHFELEEPQPPVTHQTLIITIHVDERIFEGLHGVTLECSIGAYSASQLGKILSDPSIRTLTQAHVTKLSNVANALPGPLNALPDDPLRDQARTVIFGLPGAHLVCSRPVTLSAPN